VRRGHILRKVILIERPNVYVLDDFDYFEIAPSHKLSSRKEMFGIGD
jgi:hypothetical protein